MDKNNGLTFLASFLMNGVASYFLYHILTTS